MREKSHNCKNRLYKIQRIDIRGFIFKLGCSSNGGEKRIVYYIITYIREYKLKGV